MEFYADPKIFYQNGQDYGFWRVYSALISE